MKDGTPVLLAVVADGAGSAPRAEFGALLACSRIMDEATAYFSSGGQVDGLTRALLEAWIGRFREYVHLRARSESLRLRDFACTLLIAAVGRKNAAFAQIGDGAIVIADNSDPGEYCYVFWPEKGEYANMTHFATDESASEHLEFALVNRAIGEVALFTDGLERLALQYEQKVAYAPFFRPIFSELHRSTDGTSDALSRALWNFLASPRVNARTDDDKTLVIAVRPPAPLGSSSGNAHGEHN